MKKKRIVCVAIIVILWFGLGAIDFLRVKSFEKPLFCVSTESYDGGSGYSFDIKGNFMPEDELSGVTEYVYYILNFETKSGIRD